jgi:transcriptional regulator GlxA family with amidase domain
MVAMQPRKVLILAFPGIQPLDVIGPAEVFSCANQLAPDAYDVEVTAAASAPIIARGGGYGIMPATTTAAHRGSLDTLIVAGGRGVKEAAGDEALLVWVRGAAGHSRRIASVCTGAFMLAAAGVLDGRRATTHWAYCEELAQSYPEIHVDSKPIFVRDENVWTSAGVTAGMDLALALVEDDLGPEIARASELGGRPSGRGSPSRDARRPGGDEPAELRARVSP